MQHFEISHVAKYEKVLSRDVSNRQLLKVRYGCNKGFCKRKGRGKAAPVSNHPGRFVCAKCADKLANGEVVPGLAVVLL